MEHPLQVFLEEQHAPAVDVVAELGCFRVARAFGPESRRGRLDLSPVHVLLPALEVPGQRHAVGGRELEPDLEPAPRGAVEHVGVVRRRDDHRPRRQALEVDEQRGDDPLDLADFLAVVAFLGDALELVEQDDALVRAYVVDDLAQPFPGLAEVAAGERVVADDVEGPPECGGDALGQRRLAVSRGSGEQDAVAGSEPGRGEDVGVALLVDEIGACLADLAGEDEIVGAQPRLDLVEVLLRLVGAPVLVEAGDEPA